jgi:hypothetical protein
MVFLCREKINVLRNKTNMYCLDAPCPNLTVYTHVGIKIYREFYHCIVYIANEGRHVKIKK